MLSRRLRRLQLNPAPFHCPQWILYLCLGMHYGSRMRHVTWVEIHLLRYVLHFVCVCVCVCVCMCADLSLELSWYTRRASLAAIYTVAGAVVYFLIATNSINPVIELHQISSPKTANQFLENLLASSSKTKEALDEVNLFASYWYKSTKAIMKSKGIIWHLTWLGYRWSGWRRRNSSLPSMVLKYQRPCSTYVPEDLVFCIHMYNVSTRRVSSLFFSSEIQKNEM